MQSILKPATEWELQRTLYDLSEARTPIEVIGNGTKRAVGRASQAGTVMTTQSLTGVPLYEPTELVMSARAGTSLARLEAELASNGQMLAFEPVDLAPLLGGTPGQASIGSVFSTNVSGARRVMAGAARDHLLGISAVTGNGQLYRSGGRVMKNVTGYDLARAVCGSWGTLSVLTEVTFKVLPASQETATLLILGLDDDIAIEALAAAVGSPYEVSAAAHIQASLAERLVHEGLRAERKSVTAVRIENFSSFVRYRADKLKDALKIFGDVHEIDNETSLAFWGELRQLSLLQRSDDPLWRISTSPQAGPRVVASISKFMRCQAFYDWAGGLVWAEVQPAADAGATDIRRVVASLGGHATLIRAAPAVRAAVDVFQPLEPGVAAITAKLKSVFDPAGILNPGRMYAAH
ncbi:MAG: FAD-binding protein [Hyphomicrobiaceae bacterium]